MLGDDQLLLEVQPQGGRPKQRRHGYLLPFCPDSKLVTHNQSLVNGLRSVVERVFLVKIDGEMRPPPRPTEDSMLRVQAFIRRYLKPHLHSLTPLSYEQLLSTYVGHKRGVYERAYQTLLRRGLEKKDAYITAFTKFEKLVGPLDGSDKDFVPRMISPRSPVYNLVLGRFTKRLEARGGAYSAVNTLMKSPTIAKGMNAEILGVVAAAGWRRFTRPVEVSFDVSRFDQHVSVAAMQKIEHYIYEQCFSGSDRVELRNLLKQQLQNRCFYNAPEGRIKWMRPGGRMSGDMNTGLGNSLIMACCLMTYFEERLGPTFMDQVSLLINGDDSSAMMETATLRKLNGLSDITAFFESCGFTLKVEEPKYVLEEVEFCGAHPVFDGRTWVMMRDPRVCLHKDNVTLNSISDVGSWNWNCQAISDCGKAMAGDLPILGALYRAMDRGHPVKDLGLPPRTGMEFLSRGCHREFAEPSAQSRLSVYLAFGLTPDRQEAIERWLLANAAGWAEYRPRTTGLHAASTELKTVVP